jgi:DNA-binding transcriptional regulator YdaS (Cro superfamily)
MPNNRGMDATKAVKKACDHVGGAAKLARALSVTPPTVSEWVSGRRDVPVLRCPQIERITQGAVTRRDLRPDDWHAIWPELQTQAPTEA